jgi:hypothetical protein
MGTRGRRHFSAVGENHLIAYLQQRLRETQQRFAKDVERKS